MARQRIGREFRCRLQEEARKRNCRITDDFIYESQTMRGLRENGLALDDQNFRIPGKNPQVLLEECSLRELAAETITDRQGNPVGQSYIEHFFAPTDSAQEAWIRQGRMREGGDVSAVDYSMFKGITGQILIHSTLQGFEHEEFKLTKAAGTYNTSLIDGEVVPGVSLPITDDLNGTEDLMKVKPQQPFPYLNMGENFIVLPETEMRGGIMGIDRLAIYGDRTGLVAKNAAQGARLLGIRKEQRGLQMLLGGDTTPYVEKYAHDKARVTLDPYQAADGTTATQLAGTALASRPFPFVNDIPSNPLKDWHAFETADNYQSKLVDPNDGMPIVFKTPKVFACFTERFNIAVVLKAFETWRISQATSAVVSGSINTIGPNPIQDQLGNIDVQVSRMLRQEMIKSGLYSEAGVSLPQADKVWWYGDMAEAIKYITNWNIKVIMAPANSEAEFTQDIVLRWRFDERGRWGWFNPRAIQRHNYKTPA
jgi:hypothetical protein